MEYIFFNVVIIINAVTCKNIRIQTHQYLPHRMMCKCKERKKNLKRFCDFTIFALAHCHICFHGRSGRTAQLSLNGCKRAGASVQTK